MNALHGPSVFSTDAAEGRAIPIELEIVCLWSAFGLIPTALFLALGLRVDIEQALMLAG
jgi:hypothetical protein